MLEKSERKGEMLEKLNVTEKETRNHWTLIDNARNQCTNGKVRKKSHIVGLIWSQKWPTMDELCQDFGRR